MATVKHGGGGVMIWDPDASSHIGLGTPPDKTRSRDRTMTPNGSESLFNSLRFIKTVNIRLSAKQTEVKQEAAASHTGTPLQDSGSGDRSAGQPGLPGTPGPHLQSEKIMEIHKPASEHRSHCQARRREDHDQLIVFLRSTHKRSSERGGD